MSSDIFEEIVEQRKNCLNGDQVYLDNDSYFELLKDDNMIRASEIASTDVDSMRVAGMEVRQVPQLDQGVMVLDSSAYPVAQDFKKGRTQAIPLSLYYPNR